MAENISDFAFFKIIIQTTAIQILRIIYRKQDAAKQEASSNCSAGFPLGYKTDCSKL